MKNKLKTKWTRLYIYILYIFLWRTRRRCVVSKKNIFRMSTCLSFFERRMCVYRLYVYLEYLLDVVFDFIYIINFFLFFLFYLLFASSFRGGQSVYVISYNDLTTIGLYKIKLNVIYRSFKSQKCKSIALNIFSRDLFDGTITLS